MTTYTKATTGAWSVTAISGLLGLCAFGFTFKAGAVIFLSLALNSVVHFVAGVIVGADSVDEHDEYETP